MTVGPQSYLINWKQLTRRIKDPELFIIEDCLEPDTRLQAIANASRCEHGKIDWHWVEDKVRGMPLVGRWRCDGATELRSLLNALTKENTA